LPDFHNINVDGVFTLFVIKVCSSPYSDTE